MVKMVKMEHRVNLVFLVLLEHPVHQRDLPLIL